MWRPADIERARSQPRTLRDHEHRPWPLPDRPWVMGQTWEHLLFAHWRVPFDALRAAVPPQIPLDTFDGSAWVGVTPFAVTGMRARFSMPLPYAARFPEINVRTYATVDGRPGIWFFSLDTPNRLAVATARRVYRLPYFRSRISMRPRGGEVAYGSKRVDRAGPAAAFDARYAATGPPAPATQPGSFERWATERYCLYTLDDRERVLRGDIHHRPWPLRPATAEIRANTMGTELGVELDGDPMLHYADRQDVVFWLNEPA
jgi:uncharacterized protein YqjF (DUF2071 family)